LIVFFLSISCILAVKAMTWSNSILFYFVTISSFLGGKSESILVRIPPNPDQRQSNTYWRFSVYKVENFLIGE